jgi:hypothetical protein
MREHAHATAFLPLTWFVGVLDKFSTGREFHTNGLRGSYALHIGVRLLTDLSDMRYGLLGVKLLKI